MFFGVHYLLQKGGVSFEGLKCSSRSPRYAIPLLPSSWNMTQHMFPCRKNIKNYSLGTKKSVCHFHDLFFWKGYIYIYDRHLFNLGCIISYPVLLVRSKPPTKRRRRHFAIMGCAAGSTVKYLEAPGGLKARDLKGLEEQKPKRNSWGEMVKDFSKEIHGEGSLDMYINNVEVCFR